MKSLSTLLVLGLVTLLAGCVSSSAKLDRVQNGMTRDTVISLLGRPDGTRVRGNSEYLTYYLTLDQATGEQPYLVRLVDGEVDRVGRFVQLNELEHIGAPNPSVGMGAILTTKSFPNAATQLRTLAARRERGEISETDYQTARQDLLVNK
jgi:hypothetical protein